MKAKEYLNQIEMYQTCIDQRTKEKEDFQKLLVWSDQCQDEPIELKEKLQKLCESIDGKLLELENQRDTIISQILTLKGDELGQRILYLCYVKGIRDRGHLESVLGYTKNYISERHIKALRRFSSQFFG